MLIDAQDIDVNRLYQLIIGAVLPRPIAWIGSRNLMGQPNLAPFSFFTVASVNPPVLAVSILNKDEGEKDSLINIRKTGCFSISIVSHELVAAMSTTGVDYAPDVNEFEVAGVTAIPCSRIDSVRVGECKVAFECTLRDVLSHGDQPMAGNLVLADVLAIHIDERVLDGQRIDLTLLDTVGRASGAYYTTTRDKFELRRMAHNPTGKP